MDRDQILENVRQTIELNEFAIEILRQRFRREDPGASEHQIESALVEYLKRLPSPTDRREP